MLCPSTPFDELPCNTHIFGGIAEANLTVNAVAHILPNQGYTEPNGKTLESTCTREGKWEPPISHLTVKRKSLPLLDRAYAG